MVTLSLALDERQLRTHTEMHYKKLAAGSLALLVVALVGLSLRDSSLNGPSVSSGGPDGRLGNEQRDSEYTTPTIALRRERLAPHLAAEIEQSTLTAPDLIRLYAPKANENPAIGLTLAKKLSPCLDDTSPDRQLEMLNSGAPLEVVEGTIAAEQACRGLSERDLLALLDTLEIAAKRGTELDGRTGDVLYFLNGAMLVGSPLLSQNLEASSRYRGNAIAFLNTAAAQGSTESMYWLSSVYEDGRLTARDPAAALIMHDAYVRARGHESALDRERRQMLEKSLPPEGSK